MKIQIDPLALTFGDMEDAEANGVNLLAALDRIADSKDDLSVLASKDLVDLIWIFGRHTDPAFTRDAARALQVGDVELEFVKTEG